MDAVINITEDILKLSVNHVYDTLIFKDVDFKNIHLPTLNYLSGYLKISLDDCINVSELNGFKHSQYFDDFIVKSCDLSDLSSKDNAFYNKIKSLNIEKIRYVNYDVSENIYLESLLGIMNTSKIYLVLPNSYGKTIFTINKSSYFSEQFLYKILDSEIFLSESYFEDGMAVTEANIKSMIRKNKIKNLINERA